MSGLVIVLAMTVITVIAMVTDLTDLHKQIEEQNKQYNELKKRL